MCMHKSPSKPQYRIPSASAKLLKPVHAVIVIQTDRKQPILLKLPACLLTKTVSQY